MDIILTYNGVRGLCLAVLCTGLAVSGAAQTYSAVDLGAAVPAAINNSGQIVLNSFNFGNPGGNAMLYNNGTTTNLGELGNEGSLGLGLNNSGQVVGYSTANLPHSFLYSNGHMTDLGVLSGSGESQANGINSSGQVVGRSENSSNKFRAFIWSGGTYTDLGPIPGGVDSQGQAINDKGQVAGRTFVSGGPAYIFNAGTWTSIGTLPGFTASAVPNAINNSGQVVGYSQNSSGVSHAFRYSAGTMADLGTLSGGPSSVATDINSSGQIVGYSTLPTHVQHAFLFSGGTLSDLNSLVTAPSGAFFNSANSINDNGQIVATASNGHGYLITTSFGHIDTPVNNITGVAGAIGVTGWALSLPGVQTIGIYREPVTGETPSGNGLVFLLNATVVPGTRPDVAAAYPGYPCNTCGWGGQILTNELPNSNGSAGHGNGTYVLHVLITNNAGHTIDLGKLTMTVDNASSVLPFGTIDTPSQGGTASGTAFVNFGWVLAPQPNTIPVDGSTLTVYIDKHAQSGHPNYNHYRVDIATLFPGLNNSGGAVGFYMIDTTKLTNGLHTISWTATDNAGHTTGLGSRFFNVQN